MATPLMQVRLDKAKVSLLHHVKNLDNDSLAKQIYEEQCHSGWPGLVMECKEIIDEWKLPDIINQEHKFSKAQWKMLINRAAKIKNGELLVEMMNQGYSELEIMKSESYEEKAYLKDMSMYNARVNFSLRTRMFKCKLNFMNDPAYKAEMWRCDSCETCIDSQSHILYCPAYRELREGKSLTSDLDVVNYFREVMRIRSNLELNK